MKMIQRVKKWYRPSKGPIIIGWAALVLGGLILFLGETNPCGLGINPFFQDVYVDAAFTLFSISGTVLIIDRLNQAKSDDAVLMGLLRDMSGADNALSVRATRELRAMEKLSDGFLSGRDFSGANLNNAPLHGLVAISTKFIGCQLRSADLSGSSLSNAILNRSDLGQANLEKIDLQNASLVEVILTDADMAGANLRGANLFSAAMRNSDLRDIDLRDTVLIGADLTNVRVKGAKVGGAKINSDTKLGQITRPTLQDPDGNLIWPPDTVL